MEREYFVEGDTGRTRDKSKILTPSISGIISGRESNTLHYFKVDDKHIKL